MIEAVVLGTIQGITEWLPISSKAAIIFVKNTFFESGLPIETLIKQALFLHLGTFLAALIYFRHEIKKILHALFKPSETEKKDKKVLVFLIISTLISGLLGFLILKSIGSIEAQLKIGTDFINIVMAGALFVTAFLQLKTKKDGLKTEESLTPKDGVILGLVQACAAIPGLSRSGLTISTLLLRKFDDIVSLRLSFLMSLPIVLMGNIVLVAPDFHFSLSALVGLITSFIVGLLTINFLMKLSRKINFGYFALGFGVLVALSVFIQ